jgi:hypothetical protein
MRLVPGNARAHRDNDFIWWTVRNDLPKLIAYLKHTIPDHTA